MQDLGGNPRIRVGAGQLWNAEQQGWTEQSQARLAEDTTDLNRKGRKRIRKDHKESRPRIFTDSRIELLFAPDPC